MKTSKKQRIIDNIPILRVATKGVDGGIYVGDKLGRTVVGRYRTIGGKPKDDDFSRKEQKFIDGTKIAGAIVGAEIAVFGTGLGLLQFGSSVVKAFANKTGLREKDPDTDRIPRIQRMHEALQAKRQGRQMPLGDG